MKERLRQRALELGFDDCRFTTADAPASSPQFQNWIAEGRHGEMGYLERNAPKRVNPQLVLPGARSLIGLAVSYERGAGSMVRGVGHTSESVTHESSHERGAGSVWRVASSNEPTAEPHLPEPSTRNLPGRLARYAGFMDYHAVLGERLKTLAAFVDGFGGPGTRSLWYVDTGPILERDFAQRAGVGFIGKHTNVISRKLGNWIFLAEILTTLELEPDEPEKNRCGSCTRCITACPSQAIPAPFQLDARLCISYLTVELKGPIPIHLRPLIGNRIYGCDDCLAACPWNRFAREGSLMKPHARADLATPDLIELLKLDDAGFKQRFAGTPLLRTKRRGLLRNVCVALGNVGDKSALPALVEASQDAEPLIREHARWAVGTIQGRSQRK